MSNSARDVGASPRVRATRSATVYAAAKISGCSEDLSWCSHSCEHEWVSKQPRICGRELWRGSHPGYPRPLARAKGDLPGGFERLKEFIWLEKRSNGERVDEAKADQEKEDVGGHVGVGGWWPEA